ncbi:unnamed protein product [Zymoseptoria tritici ST99CH_1A5]|uniref:Uncharacterized protein n=3 Tax=Zymoseptoria tritici TaxID=1047171 RepID=A0A1X7RQY6_ZYMT9|nr:unnamed protein product [Zymoseptoria tritici ST99CH_3D7]SMR50803.1 unnamed protein product [Zymoseptoria tritici ST99CH_1E4]SMR51743.1 unnamed protein product [Zymoseptoria tritici ST99CH_3D1]SMY23507.1 unnamed protein product [Zymoseptoria tritici ST99CH_1A5]
MSQQHQMAMGGMGGPVGGGSAQPANAGTPTNSANVYSADAVIKKLNTSIYEYLLCNGHYEVARAFHKDLPIEESVKQSPSQRNNQANGADGNMDMDSKEHVNISKRPSDLPAPHTMSGEDGPFLQDWWCQFWELYHGNRQRGKPTVLNYVGQQRVAQKARTALLVDPNAMQRGYSMMNNGMPGGDMRQAVLKNGMNAQQQQLQQMKLRQAQGQGNPMQGNPMERQGSQMDQRGSGSPNNGDAPSPKRQRLDGNMQQNPQARPGQPGQGQGGNPSMEVYSQSIQQQMQAAMQKTGSNGNKGMSQNPQLGPGGAAHSSPMSQQGMDGNSSEFYAQQQRMAMPQNGVPGAAPGQQGANNGNHALQDYQMQLMLLEQQNKKRLLMARQEQETLAHPSGGPPGGPQNGVQYAPGMSPQGGRDGQPPQNPNDMQRGTPNMKKADMSPNGGDMTGRGSPAPNMMDPSAMNPAMRQQLMMPNGQMMRPPSSHPALQGMTPQQQMEMMQRGALMQNGGWQGQQPPPGMMQGQGQPGPGGQPGQQPNMTPRQGNMPPPPAPPAATGGTGPSSPAQQPQPPTPVQANKAKPGGKKDNKKGNNKKGPAAAASNDTTDQPPTPTPPPPVTPNNAASFNQNKSLQMPNGGNQPGGGPNQQQPHPNAHNVQQQQQQQQQQNQQNQDMGVGAPFGDLGGDSQFSNMDFAALDSGDVLDNFDFDSFLNNNDEGGLGFDANFAFGDSIETDI